MPRYYFHIRDGIGDARDEEGLEVADADAARAKAVEGIRSILAEDVKEGLLDLRGGVDIADEAGAVVLSVAFADAVELRLDDRYPPDPEGESGA